MKRVGVVVAAGRARLVRRHPAEFGGPENQRVLEQAPLLEVGQKGGGGLVEDRARAARSRT